MKGWFPTAIWSLVAFLAYTGAVYVLHRRLGLWIGAAEALAVIVTVLAALLVGKVYLKRATKVLRESIDPDFGELTSYPDNWLSILDREGFEEPVFLSGEGTSEPTLTQRSLLLEMMDAPSRWMDQIKRALEKEGAADFLGKAGGIVILEIALHPRERGASVSFWADSGEPDESGKNDWIAEFEDGELKGVKREEL